MASEEVAVEVASVEVVVEVASVGAVAEVASVVVVEVVAVEEVDSEVDAVVDVSGGQNYSQKLESLGIIAIHMKFKHL